MRRITALVLLAASWTTAAAACDVRIATWNLGWHLSQAEAQSWIDRCGAPFALKEATRQWEPAPSGIPGWELRWGRDARIQWDISVLPPCDVFQVNFRAVPATAEADKRRSGHTCGAC